MPLTARIDRAAFERLDAGDIALTDILADGVFPLIARPVNSHAGLGLERLDTAAAIGSYLAERQEGEFYISRFVDYRSADGLYRKYRIVLVDGRPFACHMALADQWRIWYLNAGMRENAEKRAVEAAFMAGFDEDFARRHAGALGALAQRIGLDYFAIDCAEMPNGDLLVFEADIAMIVHDMDDPKIYPYKPPQMRKVFDAFRALLHRTGKSSAASGVAA
jgi:glutathione synthase/RimK-type ligase-like ATP-grasp enzyme